MLVSWFSAGCSSFMATYLLRDEIDRVVFIEIPNHHPDTGRFVSDAEKLLGVKIERIKSDRWLSVDDVIERERYINGPSGAPCTKHLKREVREAWERQNGIGPDDEYVWGYDASESGRADRLTMRMQYVGHRFPLIEAKLSKADVHAMCEDLGIRRPAMYDLGYPNNNCIGCVKGGMGYWNKIREDFPEVFERRARQEREIGRSCIKGVFLDELEPGRGHLHMEVMPDCSIMCQLVSEGDVR